MFSRISFTISRVLRLRSRRANKTQTRTSVVPKAVSVPPPLPPKDHSTASSGPKGLLSPIPESAGNVVSPPLSPIEGAHTPIIIISLDPAESHVIFEKTSPVPIDVDVAVTEPLFDKRVSSDKRNGEKEASSRLSTAGAAQVLPKLKPTPLPLLLTNTGVPQGWVDVPGDTDSAFIKPKNSTRPISLFSPRPTATHTYPMRSRSVRFSVPARPRAARRPGTGAMPNDTSDKPEAQAGQQRRRSKRISAMPSLSGGSSRTTVKEKRKSRWSQQMEMPETQEVLRALSNMR